MAAALRAYQPALDYGAARRGLTRRHPRPPSLPRCPLTGGELRAARVGCERCPRRGSMSCAQAGIVQVRRAAAARPRVRVVGTGRGASALPPSGAVRGGMGLSAASPPGKALPGAGKPPPGRRDAVAGRGCALSSVPGCAAARLCAREPAGLCGNGTPSVCVSTSGAGRGGGCSPWSMRAPVGSGLSRRPVG